MNTESVHGGRFAPSCRISFGNGAACLAVSAECKFLASLFEGGGKALALTEGVTPNS